MRAGFVLQTPVAYACGAALVVANWLIGYHMLAGEARATATATQPAHGPA